MSQGPFNSLQTFEPTRGQTGKLYSLPQLEKEGIGPISKLPVSIRIVLESVLRNCDGKKITEDNVRALANWQPNGERTEEIPFVVARVLLQDFTGVPLLVDLAAMRDAMKKLVFLVAVLSAAVVATPAFSQTKPAPLGEMSFASDSLTVPVMINANGAAGASGSSMQSGRPEFTEVKTR